MPQYEVIVVLEPALSDEAVEGETNQIRALVGRLDGNVQEVQKWGKKRLAYEVRRRREGHYVFLRVDGPAALVAEVERYSRVTEPILKVLTVRADPRAGAAPPPARRKPAERPADASQAADTTV